MSLSDNKSIHLIIHPCFGKTGTTWIQTHILPQTTVLNLGKGGGLNGETFISYSLKEKQYSIFTSVKKQQDYSSRYKNSWSKINKYCDYLYQKLLESLDNKKKDHDLVAVISDETILSFGGIEINSGLLLSIMNTLENKFKLVSINIFFTINITIREQISFLKSHFCYDYINIKKQHSNFSKFIQSGAKNSQLDIFGQINYWESYLFLKSVLPSSHKINFIPYELIKSDPALFLKEYFKNIPKTNSIHREIQQVELRKKVNDNKTNKGINTIRDYTLFSRLFDFTVKYSGHLTKDFRESKPIINSKIKEFYEFLIKINLFNSRNCIELNLTKNDLKILDKLRVYYADANKHLDPLVAKSYLIKFNYIPK